MGYFVVSKSAPVTTENLTAISLLSNISTNLLKALVMLLTVFNKIDVILISKYWEFMFYSANFFEKIQ